MDPVSYQDMFSIFDNWLTDKNGKSHRLVVINVHICVTCLNNPELRKLYNTADLIGIDGMPFVRWARLFHNKKADHLDAPDIMEEVANKCNDKGYKFYLYGGYPGANEKIQEFLSSKYKNINIVGSYSPPFRPLTDDEDMQLCDEIINLHPDFIWVGLGSPKQDIWINEHINRIPGAIFIPSGATFDFFSGRIKQAPEWIRNAGFEWLYRLTQDFRRLWVRYTVYNVIFVFAFIAQLLGILHFDKNNQSN
jgi:N-acetylglucosaminyldiphosphoundecaprenol N-acetyl-beta-D-mannosaminyltransferase